jgi:hypothetical protein
MKDFFDQFFSYFKPLIENTQYRFNNPLGYAFIFSWIVLNWKAVYYFLFSDEKAADKIIFLQNIYVTETGVSYWTLICLPALIAVVYVVLAPFVSNTATGLWSIIDKTCTTWRLKYVEKIARLSEIDKANMYIAIKKLRSTHEAEVEALRREISGYQDIILIEKEKEKEKDNDNNKNLYSELKKFQVLVDQLHKKVEDQQGVIEATEKMYRDLSEHNLNEYQQNVLNKARELFEQSKTVSDSLSTNVEKNRPLEYLDDIDELLEQFDIKNDSSDDDDIDKLLKDIDKDYNASVTKHLEGLLAHVLEVEDAKNNFGQQAFLRYMQQAKKWMNSTYKQKNNQSLNDKDSKCVVILLASLLSAGGRFTNANNIIMFQKNQVLSHTLKLLNGFDVINITKNEISIKDDTLKSLLSYSI